MDIDLDTEEVSIGIKKYDIHYDLFPSEYHIDFVKLNGKKYLLNFLVRQLGSANGSKYCTRYCEVYNNSEELVFGFLRISELIRGLKDFLILK